MTSVQLNKFQRLGMYRRYRGLSIAYIILVSLQAAGLILTWALVAAYQGLYAFIPIIALTIIQYLVLEIFIFGWSEKEKIFDAVLCGEPEERREQISQNIFRNAILTSWIAPVTVWCNNSPTHIFKKSRKLAVNSKYFYHISSMTTIFVLAIVLGILSGLNRLDLNNFTKDNAPVTHCFYHENVTEFSGFTFLVNGSEFHQSDNSFSTGTVRSRYHLERICGRNEKPTDYFYETIIPITVTLLIVSLVASIILAYIGNLSNHPKLFFWEFDKTVTNDAISIKFLMKIDQSPEEFKFESEKFHNKYCWHANEPDLASGCTCLLFAFQKGMFEECEKMILRGAAPFQKNNKGKSLDSMINSNDRIPFKTKKKTWLGETFFLSMEFVPFSGIAVVSDGEGRVHWSMEMRDPDDIVIARCMLEEASVMMERSSDIQWDQILSKELYGLRVFSSTLKKSFKELKRLIQNIQKKERHRLDTFWRTPPLHFALKMRNIKLYDTLCKLGANPNAKNIDEVTPVESVMQEFTYDRMECEFYPEFIWKVLVRGGTKFIKNIDDLNTSYPPRNIFYILKGFPLRYCSEILPIKCAQRLFFHAVSECNYNELGAETMNVNYFLDLGCSLTATHSASSLTVLHLAAQHSSHDCLSSLLVKLLIRYWLFRGFLREMFVLHLRMLQL